MNVLRRHRAAMGIARKLAEGSDHQATLIRWQHPNAEPTVIDPPEIDLTAGEAQLMVELGVRHRQQD